VIDYDGPMHGLIKELEAWYPGFAFTARRCFGGERIEAVRLPGYPSMTYAVITDSLQELRRELDAAVLSLAS
jgi:hypothetical protein